MRAISILVVGAAAACSSFASTPLESVDAGSSDAAPDGPGFVDAAPSNDLHGGDSRCVPREQVCCAADPDAPTCRAEKSCAPPARSYACTEAANCEAFGDAGAVFCCLTIDKDKPIGSHCSTDPGCQQTYHDLLCRPGDAFACPPGASCGATQDYPDLPFAYHCSGYPRVDK